MSKFTRIRVILVVEVRVKLKEALDLLHISANRLAVEGKLRPATIYELLENRKKTITFETLASIIYTLNRIAKEMDSEIEFTVGDLLEYKENAE